MRRRQGSLVLLLTPYALHAHRSNSRRTTTTVSLSLLSIADDGHSMQYCCFLSLEPARISAVDAAADASGLSLFVSAPSVSASGSASGSASACTVCKRLWSRSFFLLFYFCCFCFCFVADHESPNSHSRRLLFDLNGLWVSVVLCDDRENSA